MTARSSIPLLKSLTPEQKRELVHRVVGSPEFARSQAMRAFLLFVTEHSITGHTERLKEQTIGTEVLGRRPNYDPADDNIVRVRAKELRDRLEKYFTSEGLEETFIITIPKGSYAAEFKPRDLPLPPPAPETSPANSVAVAREKNPITRYWIALAVLILALIATLIVLTMHGIGNGAKSVASTPSGPLRDFWGQFFLQPNQDLRIVYADTSLGLWQDIGGKDLNLGEYLSHKYLEVQGDTLREVATRRSTSPADLSTSVRLATLAAAFGGRVDPRSARNVDAEFVYQGNAVLLGSHRSNPWDEVFDATLNFQLGKDPHSGAPLFRNRNPQSSEAPMYAIPEMLDEKGTEDKEFLSFGLLALLNGCGSHGLIVLDEGLNMQATQAIGDLITDSERLDALLRRIGHKPGTAVHPFEALIQITSLPGGYDNPQVVAFRHLPQGCPAHK